MPSSYRIEKAEEGTPAVDTLLAAGWEPFAVVSTPVPAGRAWDSTVKEYTDIIAGHVNVIWFRRVVPHAE